MLPQPQKTTQQTFDDVLGLIQHLACMNAEHPADLRERMRGIIDDLPNVARAVYNRENIQRRDTPLLTIVETVLGREGVRRNAKQTVT